MTAPSPAPIRLDQSRVTTLEVPFRFLTWVFGGGVKHNPNATDSMEPMRPFDPVTPVRSSGIRGQLRFWWRATTGARLGSLEDLKRREAEVWGGIWGGEPTHGKVGLTVQKTSGDNPMPVLTYGWRTDKNYAFTTESGSRVEYGAFPLRPENKPKNLRKDGDASSGQGTKVMPDDRTALHDHSRCTYLLRVDLSNPDDRMVREVELALSAWLAFGGYGGRTTRGFGAVALTEDQPEAGITDDPLLLKARYEELGNTDLLAGVPSLAFTCSKSAEKTVGAMKFGRQQATPMKAWTHALGALRSFRQGVEKGRNPGQTPRKPGRSRWPEPDELRALTGQSHPLHTGRLNMGAAFPRADFGLPIIFHFKDSDTRKPRNPNADPRDLTLVPSPQQDRVPSPLILTATRQGYPVALHLQNASAPDNLWLMDGKKPFKQVPKNVDSKHIALLSQNSRNQLELIRPLHIETSQGSEDTSQSCDPINAFLDYFETY